jgi:hypothetical protein
MTFPPPKHYSFSPITLQNVNVWFMNKSSNVGELSMGTSNNSLIGDQSTVGASNNSLIIWVMVVFVSNVSFLF